MPFESAISVNLYEQDSDNERLYRVSFYIVDSVFVMTVR